MAERNPIIVGASYGRWVVQARLPKTDSRLRKALCLCACGKTKAVWETHLKRGLSKSCGCLSVEITTARSFKHGEHKRGSATKENAAWRAMKARCLNERSTNYRMWGGRGIKVCDRWLNSFENFLADMGRAPSKHHSLDRINNDGHYEPGNVRWATKSDQANNRRSGRLITYNGVTKTVAEWSALTGISYTSIYQRVKRGLPIDRVLSTEKLSKYPRRTT